MDLSGDWLSGGMFAGGVALMTLVLMRRWLGYQRRNRRRGSRNRSSNVTQKRTSDPQQPLLDAPPEIHRWQVEMHDVARDLKGELDSKMVAVQTLIGMARAESDRLQKLLSAAGDRHAIEIDFLDSVVEMESLADVSLPETDASSDVESRKEQIYSLADRGTIPPTIAAQLGLPLGEVEMLLSLR
jgi:hypothetical protein